VLARRFRLSDHVLWPFVLAQTQVRRMAHLAGRGPFREFDLGHEFGLNPCGYGFILNAVPERRRVGAQPPEIAMQLLERRMREAGADMADVAPFVTLGRRAPANRSRAAAGAAR